MSDERRQRATEMYREVVPNGPEFEPFDAVSAWTRDVVFGELWPRDVLSMRERRLICIICAATTGNDLAIEAHAGGALDSGDFTMEELQEICLWFGTYYGLPASIAFNTYLNKRLFAETGAAPEESKY